MPQLSGIRRGRASRASLGGFLLLTVVLAAWLGYEALNAANSHRRTAEAVLHDYAAIAVSSYTRTARNDLDDMLDAVFHPIHHDLAEMRALPDPRAMLDDLDDAAREGRCRRCTAILEPQLTFAADARTREVRAWPAPVPGLLSLTDTILSRRADIGPGGHDDGLLVLTSGILNGDSLAVGYTVARSAQGDARVLGFVVPVAAFGEFFEAWFARGRLLPEPIGGDLPSDSLLQLTVAATDGPTIFSSPVDYPPTMEGEGSLGIEYGDLRVSVAMRPDKASQLIIGGLPSSRLPLLVTLLILTLGVGGATLIQFRREADFQKLRDDFVSGVSHELRTPLAQIRMFAELQSSGKLTDAEDRARATSVIHRESTRLSHLVDNVLQFSRLRHGVRTAAPVERMDLAAATEDGIDAMSSVLEGRAMRLEQELTQGLMIRANRDAITRIMVNLIDNAAKYGPEGQTVRVGVSRVPGHARITVEDEGPGVPPQDRHTIFEAYRRLERDVRAARPGTGIGLSVVATLAQQYNGTVAVEDAEQGGARFVVDFPLDTSLADSVVAGPPPRAAEVGP